MVFVVPKGFGRKTLVRLVLPAELKSLENCNLESTTAQHIALPNFILLAAVSVDLLLTSNIHDD